MLNRNPGLIFGFLVILLIACFMGLLSMTLLIQNVVATSSGNCSTRGITNDAPSNPTATVQKYFYAMKNKDYDQACSLFDLKATIEIGKKDRPFSPQLMKSVAGGKNAWKSYSIISISNGTANQVIISVDVIHGSKNQPTVIQAWLQQEGGGWMIDREDVISG
jgi:hypothetical protein